MKATHFVGEKSVSGNVSDKCGFLLSNGMGSFANISGSPASKYSGLFLHKGGRTFRTVEDVSLVNSPRASELVNRLFCFERKRGVLVERFFFPRNTSALVYELSEPYLASVTFDMREAYDFRQWGRDYDVRFGDGLTVVSFAKKSHLFEDMSHGSGEYRLFAAVRHDGKAVPVRKWLYRQYESDKLRSSMPYTRYVFDCMRVVSKRLVVSVSDDRQAAVDESGFVFRQAQKLLEQEKAYSRRFISRDVAYSCASKSLSDLYSEDGVFAGLPWFFQHWSRDEAVASRALLLLGAKGVKANLLSRLKCVLPDGRIPNVFGARYSCSTGNVPLGSADGVGWLALRLKELVQMNKLAPSEKKFLAEQMKKVAEGVRRSHERDGLIHNSALETWMDTAVANDAREGFRVEIQALHVSVYDLLLRLTKEQEYAELRDRLAEKVKSRFWNGAVLADGLDDFTPRPNAFIAAYVWPGLLSKEEWSVCFRSLIGSLWLDWGGFASIDKLHPLFKAEHSGEPPISYHRGDSWFWINNLAAICMARVNRKAFGSYIKAVYDASSKDLLWSGALGSCSELSSAMEQRAEGSLSQAWSSAMHIELAEELKKK
ncbi:hypothetical protein HY640_01785 [Candidatus Woesearchaeota archaeon]|nr:hypothetical protein [Candidatus Woesearchaeota archaeon]